MKGYSLIVLISLVLWHIAVADYRNYASLDEFFKSQVDNETFVRMYEEHLKHFQDDRENLKASEPFKCKKFPTPRRKDISVHKLTPMDVKVVAAMGDSITAGTGINARTVVGELIQVRGLSWSIGGDDNIDSVDTLANILKMYNPQLTGYSTGWGPAWWESSAHLNVAIPGDKAKDMPGQAKLLVKRLKHNSKIDFEKDWKVITIFIGGNDLCDFCDNKKKYGAESYRAHLQEALDYLHSNVPRAFVNLVEILPITVVKDLNKNLICDIFHFFGCRCAAYPRNSQAEAELKAENQKYRDVLEELIGTGRYDTKDDFTVVLQPFFTNTYPPKKPDGEIDLSYFAPDCFHFSLKGHRAASDALWNNMVEPSGKKRKEWMPREQFECPTATHPYFYTYKNSQGALDSEVLSGSDQAADNRKDPDIGAVYQGSETEEQSGRSTAGNQSSTIATATGVTTGVFVVIVLATVAVVIWRKRAVRRDYQNLLGHTELK